MNKRLENGSSEVLQALLATLPALPGVYRMLDVDAKVLYVGKARQLRARVGSYFQNTASNPKTRAMVAKIHDIQTTVTHTETEALLLEQTLIKALHPPYNILLRDDKSYPFIRLSDAEDFPRLSFHRGGKSAGGSYFGPYPGSVAVRETLAILQKLFKVRQCDDVFFRNRQRPCLQYQIGRCRAPCVGLVSAEDYARDVRSTRLFLQGKNRDVLDWLLARMQAAATAMDYEQAAMYRDQLRAVQGIEEQQSVYKDQGQVDVVALAVHPGGSCFTVLSVRQGRVMGSSNFFPQTRGESQAEVLLSEFLPQYYLNPLHATDLPDHVLLQHACEGLEVLEEALQQTHGQRLKFTRRLQEYWREWQELALLNAEQALKARLANRLHYEQRLVSLAEVVGLTQRPQRLECFDISHSHGESTMASCVVFGPQGPCKKDYRLFHIEGITPGDDYAAMRQALHRRFSGSQALQPQPDLLVIDGGKGQWHCAESVREELGLAVTLVGVAKGEGRKPGLETLHLQGDRQVQLPMDHPGFLLIQHIRDEAHRFAVKGHRQNRDRRRKETTLDRIAGVGPVRRKTLLAVWGSLAAIQRASARELATTPGISLHLAQQIYEALHGGTGAME